MPLSRSAGASALAVSSVDQQTSAPGKGARQAAIAEFLRLNMWREDALAQAGGYTSSAESVRARLARVEARLTVLQQLIALHAPARLRSGVKSDVYITGTDRKAA